MNHFSSSFTLGILGGGQLGKMLLQETRKWDVKTHVLDPSDEAPCRIGCDYFEQGSLMDYDTVYRFGKQVDVLTIEIEAVNVAALEQLEKEGVKTYPNAATLKNIQDKGIQKQFYTAHQLPTSNFELFEDKTALVEAIEKGKVTLPFVWKSRRGGYDGRGVSIIRQKGDYETLPDVACLAEDLVPIKRELAVIVARNPSGQVSAFPVVEMEFHPVANQVEYVICPARIEAAIAHKARAVAEATSKAFEHVGLLAVELFQTEEDEILINEVAPRPHNSGHYSIEASYTSQFEQHLRALLDLPLGDTASKVAGVMVNLVGAEGYTGPVVYKNIESILNMPGVKPHIYGKKEVRPFRKMGHITVVHPEVEEARKIAEEVKKVIKVISE